MILLQVIKFTTQTIKVQCDKSDLEIFDGSSIEGDHRGSVYNPCRDTTTGHVFETSSPFVFVDSSFNISLSALQHFNFYYTFIDVTSKLFVCYESACEVSSIFT